MADKLKILTIDDHQDNLILLEELLSEEYQVNSFSNPVEALDRLTEINPDLIITDLMMPEMDGIELIRRTKTISPSLPIIILTASDEIKNLEKAYEAGACGHLLKPMNFSTLLNKIKSTTSSTLNS
jgi:CheY-like chemotaxis protein